MRLLEFAARSMSFLIYGANGYSGGLIARLARDQGLRPILAGRNAAEVAALAGSLAFEQRIFGLDEPALVEEGIRGLTAVLHCAGPFSRTSRPMADACLRTQHPLPGHHGRDQRLRVVGRP